MSSDGKPRLDSFTLSRPDCHTNRYSSPPMSANKEISSSPNIAVKCTIAVLGTEPNIVMIAHHSCVMKALKWGFMVASVFLGCWMLYLTVFMHNFGRHWPYSPQGNWQYCLRAAWPYCIIEIGLIIGTVIVFILDHFLIRHVEIDLNACSACGYSLKGNETGRCPECGATMHRI